MGVVTNSAVTARARTRRRAAGELTGRAERDTRIAAAAAQVSAAQDAIRGNAERRALAVAAAQRDERDANAAADRRIDAAVRQLRADGLTVAAIAELLHLPAAQVRRLIKRAHHAAGGGAAAWAAPEGRGPGE